MANGREPLRIPQSWKDQARAFVIQLERILDKLFNRTETNEEKIAENAEAIENLDSTKLDKTNVYNGLDKTTSGFALDAREGKVLSDIGSTIQGALAIIANGDTHIAISSGEYVFVKNNTHGLTDGLYKASANVAVNGAISNNNMTVDSKGGLNALNSKITTTQYEQLTINAGFSAGKFIIGRCGKYRVATGSLQPTNAGIGIDVLTLPAEDRPPIEIYGSCTGYIVSVQSEITIGSDGTVKINVPTGGNNNTVKFNISWLIN